MGTYLATGIVKAIVIPKKHIRYETITIDSIVNGLEDELNLSYYNFSEDKDAYIWEIQPKILENNLTDFLASQYQMYNPESYYKMQKEILQIKQAANGEDIIKLASSEGFYNFQLVDTIIDYISVPIKLGSSFNESLMAYYSLIAYFMDGKIIMECYANILRYFENMTRLQKEKYPIVDCVKVMITS